MSAAAWRQARRPRVDAGTGPRASRHSRGAPARWPGRWRAAARPGPHDLAILRALVGIGLQPALTPLLVLAQLPLQIVGPVGLLAGHRQPTRHLGRLVAAAAQPAKHAGRLATGGRLLGGQGLIGLLAASSSPFELAAAVA